MHAGFSDYSFCFPHVVAVLQSEAMTPNSDSEAIFVEDSDFDEDELVLMEFVSKTEIKARFIGPLAEGLYDITVIDGLWSQKFVNGLEVLNPPKAPLGEITFLDPISNEKFGSPQGDAIDIPVLVSVTEGCTTTREYGSK